MTKVFIGGSRAISRLDEVVCRRLDNIVAQDLPVLVGDANGADRIVQKYLLSKSFGNVEVFCSGTSCRHNEGGWKIRNIAAGPGVRGAAFYSAKDRQMAKEASVGLMIWDGESAGTALNVLRLVSEGKIAVMYSVPAKAFLEFRDRADWENFSIKCGPSLRRKIGERVAFEPVGVRALANGAASEQLAAS